MEQLSKGQRLALATAAPDGVFQVGVMARGLALDFACFGLDQSGKLSDERYMTFFNQPKSPCGGVELKAVGEDATGFAFDLGRLPASIDRVTIAASIDGGAAMSQLSEGYVRLVNGTGEFARFAFQGADFAAEKALILGDIYRKDGQWRFMSVGQGFNGGLDALVRHFGGAVAEAAPPAASAPAESSAKINLAKRVEREAPQLVSLVKSAKVSLEKVGLQAHAAKVCLVLDISGSMRHLYTSGQVQRFSERILALGCNFDDDGEIDIFLFGKNAHQAQPMSLGNWATHVQDIIKRYPLEYDTQYAAAMEAVRRHYFPDVRGGERKEPFKAALPVYVMFLTDGTNTDQAKTEQQLRWSSKEPIFWQFMGIGKSMKGKKGLFGQTITASDFPFLEKLDDLSGRLIDNANFFSVAAPDEHSDSELYDLLMAEYPGWLRLAKQQQLLP
ncbi:MAG: VWA domain-containing protein [Pseudomonadota bacterium]